LELKRINLEKKRRSFKGTRLCPLRLVMPRIGFMTGLRLGGVIECQVITV
jgi:hypothetical protein